VCSPQEVAQLRQTCGNNFLLVCPGVRPTWADKGDQKRSLTPAQAIIAGADYLVIGRPITTATEPELAWKKISEELTAIA
ncbi:MAG: orotidine 5'-phosphate decarboxylase / HUMPS family protein, partial [Nostoc sp.]